MLNENKSEKKQKHKKEKKKLTVQDLLGLFEKASNGEADIPDSMILGRVCNFLWAARSRLIDVGGDSVTK